MRRPGPDDPLHLPLRASRGLALFLVALHGGAAACVCLASLPGGVPSQATVRISPAPCRLLVQRPQMPGCASSWPTSSR